MIHGFCNAAALAPTAAGGLLKERAFLHAPDRPARLSVPAPATSRIGIIAVRLS